MSMRAEATFQFTSWDETPIDDKEGQPKLTRASVNNIFNGDIEGESTLEYLMFYRDDGHAAFVGLERVIGRLGDRTGAFVLHHEGVFENGAARTTLTIVPGSATGALAGLHGSGSFTATHEQPTPVTLEYGFQ